MCSREVVKCKVNKLADHSKRLINIVCIASKNSIYCKPGFFLQTAAEKKPKRLSLIKIFSIKSAVYGILNQTILLIFAAQKEIKAMFVSLA